MDSLTIIVGVAIYLSVVLPLYIIARKCEHEYAWLAFIPFADFWLMCDLADVNPLFCICYLIPYVNLLFHAFLWSRLAENTNKSALWGILMVVPVLSILVGWYLALYEPKEMRF